MKTKILFILIVIGAASCSSETNNCVCPECPKTITNNESETRRLDYFDEKSQVVLNLKLDSNYIKQINSDTLKPHPTFPECINDTGHEGYPFVLKYLNYFQIQHWNLSEEINLKLIYGEIPKDTIQDEIYYYRALYFATFDIRGKHLFTKIVGKRMITQKTEGHYSSVFTSIKNNKLTITTHEKWKSAGGRFYSTWLDEYFVISKEGYFSKLDDF